MKKAIVLLLFISMITACKTTSVVNTKLDNKTERMLKGNWTITNVTFPGSDYLKVNAFNLADSQCFVGSNWNFIANNNKGTMALHNPSTNCKEFNSPITWYINKNGEFVFKIINNHKAKNVHNGYVLTIHNITQTSFDLIDKINVAGQIKNITYTFSRN